MHGQMVLLVTTSSCIHLGLNHHSLRSIDVAVFACGASATLIFRMSKTLIRRLIIKLFSFVPLVQFFCSTSSSMSSLDDEAEQKKRAQ
jgi:hypothetical protein